MNYLIKLIVFGLFLPLVLSAQTPKAVHLSLLKNPSFTKQALVDKSLLVRVLFQQASGNNQNQSEDLKMEPWNLGLRFILELSALGAMGSWGYDKGDGAMRYVYMIGVPVVAAAAWGIFAVEGDPSRSGNTILQTPGYARLALEVAFFGFSAWALHDLAYTNLAYTMGGLVLFHYAVSYERIIWLIERS